MRLHRVGLIFDQVSQAAKWRLLLRQHLNLRLQPPQSSGTDAEFPGTVIALEDEAHQEMADSGSSSA